MLPTIQLPPRVIKRKKEKQIVIELHVASAKKPKCEFFKESVAVREDSRRQIKVEQVKKALYSCVLEINDANEADAGKYKILARNEKGEIDSEVTVTMDEGVSVLIHAVLDQVLTNPICLTEEKKDKKAAAPKITQQLSSRTISVGESAEFVCRVESFEKSSVKWTLNRKTVITESSRGYRMFWDGSEARLIIDSATTEQAGSYSITVTNSVGSAESSGSLTVEGKFSDQVGPVGRLSLCFVCIVLSR